MWESANNEKNDNGIGYKKGYFTESYFVPAKTLGFSVVVFVIVATMAIIILLIRRKVVGGELGGSKQGRMISSIALTSLWLLYVIFSIFQSVGIAGIDKQSWGIKLEATNPNTICNK